MKKLFLLAACVSFANPAFAVDKIYDPYVKKGEWEAEYFGHRSIDGDRNKDNAQGHEVSVGYGVTDYWKTEFYGIWDREPGNGGTKFDAVEWENIFQLTGKGEYWLDAGASLAYEWTPESDHADAVEARLLLAKDWGKTHHVLNLMAEKDVGAGPKDGLGAALLWSSRYRYSRYFQPGFEVQLESGDIEHDDVSFNDHEQYAGPVAYGKLPIGEGLGYRAGYLFGLTDDSADGQALLQLEYELEF